MEHLNRRSLPETPPSPLASGAAVNAASSRPGALPDLLVVAPCGPAPHLRPFLAHAALALAPLPAAGAR